MKKKLIAMLLVLVMVLGVASGCGSEPDSSKDGKNSEEKTDVTDNKDEQGKAGPEEVIDITVMANLYLADITESDQAFLDAIEENTNVRLDIEIPPSSGYAEKLQLMLVSGEYPDVVMFQSTNSDAYLNAIESGVIIPINEYLDNAANLMDYTYEASWKALTAEDGNIYGVPRTSVTRADGIWLRKDWLDALGITIPENGELTIEEFTDILTQFAKNDPDGNGADDTYGIGVAVDSDKVMSVLLSSQFGDLGWQESDGEFDYITAMYDKDTTRYKKILEYTRNLYTEGILDPNSAVNDQQSTREAFWRGTTGAILDFAGNYGQHMTEFSNIGTDAELVYVFVQDENGEVKGTGYGTGMWQFWCITSECEYPEKVIEVMNYALSDEGYDKLYAGSEGIEYNIVDGERVYVDNISDVKTAFRSLFLRRAEDYKFFVKPWDSEEDKAFVTPLLEKSVNTVVRSLDNGFVPEVSLDPSYMDYQSAMAEGKAQILLGELDVDYYDELLAGWYENGGQTYVEQMNEYISK